MSDRQSTGCGVVSAASAQEAGGTALEGEHRRIVEILESINDAFYAVDFDFRFTYINRRAENIWGQSRADLLGKRLQEEFPNADPISYTNLERAMRERCEVEFEVISHALSRWVNVKAYPSTTGLSVYFRDISEQKQQEDALKRRERGQRFLNEASKLLASSLDYEQTLRNVARLAVPQLADWCTVHLADADGTLRHVAVMHTDPERIRFAEEVGRRYPPDPAQPTGHYAVVRSGQSRLVGDITPVMIRAAARDEEHYRLLMELGIRSYLCVPLIVGGKCLGAITFIGAESGHRYGLEDMALAEDLAHQAAMAVENARLYRAAQEQAAHIQALNTRLRRAMAETHHRVKNNLQIIAAMVDMQAADDNRTPSIADFERLSKQITALAAVHDLLTGVAKEDGQADVISARAVLAKLLPMLQRTLGDRPIQVDVDDVLLTPRQGNSIALLVTELVSNAVKYGLNTVVVTFRPDENTATLSVADDGSGFPPDFDPLAAANTGLELVESMARWDLGGETRYETRPEGGGLVVVRFPLVPDFSVPERSAYHN
jgi:PAS domain S-box-containing protein